MPPKDSSPAAPDSSDRVKLPFVLPVVQPGVVEAAQRTLTMFRTPGTKISNNPDGQKQMTLVLTDAREMAHEILRLKDVLFAHAREIVPVLQARRRTPGVHEN